MKLSDELIQAATDDSLGGYAVPPEYTVETAVRLGMPRLRDMLGWDIRVRAAIRDKPWWWQWLFHNYSTNKIASFLVWRWPKFPDIANAYDDCARAHQEEKERRVQKAYEFLQAWGDGREGDCAPVVVNARIGNLDGWKYCVMKVKDDDHQASPG